MKVCRHRQKGIYLGINAEVAAFLFPGQQILEVSVTQTEQWSYCRRGDPQTSIFGIAEELARNAEPQVLPPHPLSHGLHLTRAPGHSGAH